MRRSNAIADNLRLKLGGEEKKRLAKRYTENPEAYQDYLTGRFYWNKSKKTLIMPLLMRDWLTPGLYSDAIAIFLPKRQCPKGWRLQKKLWKLIIRSVKFTHHLLSSEDIMILTGLVQKKNTNERFI